MDSCSVLNVYTRKLNNLLLERFPDLNAQLNKLPVTFRTMVIAQSLEFFSDAEVDKMVHTKDLDGLIEYTYEKFSQNAGFNIVLDTLLGQMNIMLTNELEDAFNKAGELCSMVSFLRE